MIHWLGPYVIHPLWGAGYQFWSGIGSDLGELSLLAAVVAALRHKNCHHAGCWRLGHNHPEHGWPACRHHWHETPDHIKERKR